MNTARTVSEMTDVKRALEQKKQREDVRHAVEEIRIINEADYIVVMDMDHIRYSHPVSTMIGKRSRVRTKPRRSPSTFIFPKQREKSAPPSALLSHQRPGFESDRRRSGR